MKNNGVYDMEFNKHSMYIADDKGHNALEKEAAKFHNEAVDNYTKVINEKFDSDLEKSKEMVEKMNTMEIIPINNYVLVQPYKENPFDKIEVTDSGLYIPGMSEGRSFKNPDSGEQDTEVNLSVQAVVIEAAPACKYVKEGDVVYYRRVSAVPIPFFKQGFEVVPETSIQVVINEGLKKRFENYDK